MKNYWPNRSQSEKTNESEKKFILEFFFSQGMSQKTQPLVFVDPFRQDFVQLVNERDFEWVT